MPFSHLSTLFSRFFWSIRFFVLSLHPKQYRGIIRRFSMLCRFCFVSALPAIREARAALFQISKSNRIARRFLCEIGGCCFLFHAAKITHFSEIAQKGQKQIIATSLQRLIVTPSRCKTCIFWKKWNIKANFTFYNRSFVKCNSYICSDKTKQPKATTK